MSDSIPTSKPAKCCVPNCENKHGKRHRFPKNEPEIFNTWLQRIKPKDYETLEKDKMYNRYYVCDDHFSRDCFVPGTRRGLKRTAVPSLFIPGFEENVDATTLEQAKFAADSRADLLETCTSTATETMVSINPIHEIQGPSNPNPDLTSWRDSGSTETERPDKTEETVTPVSTCTAKRPRRSILRQVQVTRSSQLTPKAKHFYHTLRKWRGQMSQLRSKLASYEDRLVTATRVEASPSFQKLLQCVNDPTYHFVMCQVRNQQLKSRARRYNLEEKILALSLFKSSGKGYRLLSKIFALPSPRTLRALLQRIPFQPGVNKHIFANLRKTVEKMKKPQEKVCIITFDEMAIKSNLTYQRKEDKIVGLEDYGDDGRPLLADHANVFMLKGIYRQWKQPIAFTFSQGPIKAIKLKALLKSIIKECQSIDLDVVATVCDQGSTNQTAINMLLKETREECLRSHTENRYFGFLVEGKEVVPLYDVPHLFKGIRNNLLNKNLHYKLSGENKIAKWDHVQQFYNLDVSDPNSRICSKLTDNHVLPEKINKMKVKLCTQVFSHTVGSLMKRISQWDIKDRHNLPAEARDTADLILFLDQLFDSLNVSRKSKPQAKPLKWPVTKTSKHEEFWKEALEVLNSMNFRCSGTGSIAVVPTLKNLNFTLRGLLYLRSVIFDTKKFKFLLTGAINQDCLENFFSYIRSHGIRNTNPSVCHFTASFKSLLLNNFMSSHSPGSNCQKDTAVECLDNLRIFLTGEYVAGIRPLIVNSNADIPTIPKNVALQKRTKITRCTLTYMTGSVGRILLKSKLIRNCEVCRSNLLVRRGAVVEDDFIESRQFEGGRLTKPGDYLHFLFTNAFNSLFYLIPRVCTYKNISKLLETILQEQLNFTVINCHQHDLGTKLCRLIIRCALFWWCKQVNKIANGTDTKFGKFLSLHPNKDYIDPVKLQAYEKHMRLRREHLIKNKH